MSKHNQTNAIRIQTERTNEMEHSTPMFLTSSFCFDNAEEMRAAFADESDENIYSRFSNPKGAYAWDLLPGLMICLEQGCDVAVDGKPFDGRFLEPHRRYRVDVQHRHDLHLG